MKDPRTYISFPGHFLFPITGAIVLMLLAYVFFTKDHSGPPAKTLRSAPLIDVQCGDDVPGRIEVANQRDTFRIELQAGDSLRVQMRFIFPGYTEQITLQHPNGNRLVTALTIPNSGMAVLTYPIQEDGAYLILASEETGQVPANSANDYGISFQVTNNPGCTQPVNCGDDLEAELGEFAEMDAYAIPLRAGDDLQVRLKFVLDNFSKQIVLHHPDGRTLETVRVGPGGGLAVLNYTIPEDGTYLVRVSEENGEWARVYGISFQATNDPDCAQTVSCSEDLFRSIGKLAQTDMYTIPLQDNDLLRVQMKFTFGSYVEQLILYAPDGAQLAAALADPVSGMATLLYTIPEDGDYFLLVTEENGEWAESYGLSIQVLNNPPCAPTVSCGDDLGRDLNQRAKQDAFHLPLQAGDQLRIQMRFSAESYTEVLHLYDGNGRRVTEGAIDPATGMALLAYNVEVTGDYIVLATEKNGESARNYGISFQVLNQPACSEWIADRCVENDYRLNHPGEMDGYAFSASLEDVLFLEVDADDRPARPIVYLYDQRGALLTQSVAASDERALIEGFAFPTAGTYYLVVTDIAGRGSGGYRFSYNLVSPELQQALNLMLRDTAICIGETLDIDLTLAGARYQWSTGDTTSRVRIERPADYQVALNVNGCEIVHDFSVRSEICAPIDLCGLWIGQPYDCPAGGPPFEILELSDRGGRLTAARFNADDCLDRGQERWTGLFDQNPFPMTFSDGALESAFVVNENRIEILGRDLHFSRAGCEQIDSLGLNLFDLSLDCVDCGIFDTLSVAICEGDAYRGIVPERDTTVREFVRVAAGVDSFLTIRLSIRDTALVFQQMDLCAGERALIGDSLIAFSGQYRQVLQTETGCDSTVITSVNIKPPLVDTIDVELCPGDSLLVGNTYIKTPGFYPETLAAADGCDSVLVSAVQFRTIPSDTVDLLLCPGDSLLIGTSFVKNPGLYPRTLLSADGCDSILVSAVQFRRIPVDTIDVPLCPGDSLLIGAAYVKTPGFYAETLATAAGCDSIVVSAVEYRTVTYDTVNVQLCAGDSLLVDGAFVKTPGFYSEMLTSSNDCDRIRVSALTFRNIPADTIGVELCPGDSLVIGGTIATMPGFYSEKLLSPDGCDSILVSAIRFSAIPMDTIQVELCSGDSLLVGNSFVTTPGFYSETLAAVNGCDSILVRAVQFKTIPTDTIQVELCPGDSLLVDQSFVTTPGFYPETLAAMNGCDSILVRAVQFKTIPTDTIQVEICPGDSLLIGQSFVKTPGFYPETLAAANGCDSILVRNVQFKTVPTDTLDVQLCPGDSLLIDGAFVKTPGPYSETLTATNGCDSILTYRLAWHASYRDTLSIDLCAGESFELGADNFQSDTAFCRTLQTVNGCDSILCYQLNFLPAIVTFEEQTICAGEELNINGETINTTTSICLDYISMGGCDSTHCINVTVLDTILVSLRAEICAGDYYPLGDETYTETGVYTATFARANGCDSTVVLNLSVLDETDFNIEVRSAGDDCTGLPAQLDAGPGGAYLWSTGENTRQIEVTEAGPYSVQVTSAQGCSSEASIEVEDSRPLAVEVISRMSYNGFSVSCPSSADGVLEVEVNGGAAPYQYRWNTDADTKKIENIPTGFYEVTVTDAEGCAAVGGFDINPPPDFIVRVDVREISCAGESDGVLEISVTEGVTGPYLYSLNGAGFQTASRFANLSADNYLLRVQDINGCEHIREGTLAAPPPVSLSFPENELTAIAGDSIQLNPMANFPVDTFYWEPAIPDCKTDCFNPVIRPAGNAAYTLTAVSPTGCSASADISIRIDTADDLYIPNAFSPNGDGENDLFNVYARSNVARILSFRIFSRWGDLVFEEKDFAPNTTRGWDGRYAGQPLNAGVFIYQVVYERKGGERASMAGDVVLIR